MDINLLPPKVIVYYGALKSSIGKKVFTLPGKCVQNRLSDLSILREKLYYTEIMSSPYLYMEAFQITSSIKLEDIKVYQSFSCFSEEFEELLGHSDQIEHLPENLIVKIECSSQDLLKEQP
jgi:hypothetical protein